MNELSNISKTSGTYNDIPTILTFNTSVVNVIDDLSLIREADMENWGSGNLTYTITLDNHTDKTYTNPIITDQIDSSLALFVPGSVTINGQAAQQGEYSYDCNTNMLTINLNEVPPNQKQSSRFKPIRKQNKYFVLNSNYILTYNNNLKLDSNYVTVISNGTNNNVNSNMFCDAPYFRS